MHALQSSLIVCVCLRALACVHTDISVLMSILFVRAKCVVLYQFSIHYTLRLHTTQISHHYFVAIELVCKIPFNENKIKLNKINERKKVHIAQKSFKTFLSTEYAIIFRGGRKERESEIIRRNKKKNNAEKNATHKIKAHKAKT